MLYLMGIPGISDISLNIGGSKVGFSYGRRPYSLQFHQNLGRLFVYSERPDGVIPIELVRSLIVGLSKLNSGLHGNYPHHSEIENSYLLGETRA